MAQIRLVPSTYTRSSNSRVTVTNATNMYYNTDHTANYAELRGRNNSSSTYYAFIHGFNFGDVPSNVTINSFTVKIRCYRNSNQRTGTNYDLRLASTASNSNVIANTTASTAIETSASVITIPTGNLTWTQLSGYGSGFSIEVPLASSSNSYPYVYVYGAEILVDYTAPNVAVTGVTLDQNSASIEVGETLQLTETVAPSNATNKTVSWSSSNISVATVSSSGLVTAISAGSATITVTTVDSGYTDTCSVTVTQPVMEEYIAATSFEVGKQYLIANGNTGTVYVMTSESGGARILKGVQATITNGILSISQANANKSLFTVELDDASDTETIWLKHGTSYIYSNSSDGLRMDTAVTPRYWHYKSGQNVLWFYNGTNNEYGYRDTSGTYKYYLEVSSGNFTDGFVTSPSIADSTLPEMFIFVKYEGASLPIRVKQNGEWVTASKLFVKQNGSWIQSTTIKVKNNGTWK